MTTRSYVGKRPAGATRERLPPGQHLVDDFPVLDSAVGFTCRFALTREPASRKQDLSRRIDIAMACEVIGPRSRIFRNVYICGSRCWHQARYDRDRTIRQLIRREYPTP